MQLQISIKYTQIERSLEANLPTNWTDEKKRWEEEEEEEKEEKRRNIKKKEIRRRFKQGRNAAKHSDVQWFVARRVEKSAR